ncbi:HAD family phosphatase [Phragmitibacter flavus]|uniref:HAD family phosphatase n=1 Tax=Phragmitibacter flavus TaxID=2576071 RepID=A0A5R8KHG3_9BACT|nr:HAD family phosphatase [Phragmitibacter flavus]TLD71754.1 HAD family phosphatase [Phragmitibacter flavus]
MYTEVGFIFDWDGVVIDSHAQHEESWRLLFEELGRAMPGEFFKLTFGMRNQQIIPAWFDFVDAEDKAEIQRLGDRKEELYREIIKRDGIEPLVGVVNLLKELQALGIPAAVGSSTPRKNLDTIMSVIGVDGYFQQIVSAEDVNFGKPAPDVFLKAAQKIGRDPANCVVIEDAQVGIEAGKRAGMRVVAVATTHPIETLEGSDLRLPNLAGATVAGLLPTTANLG